jgi:hypothetical protein
MVITSDDAKVRRGRTDIVRAYPSLGFLLDFRMITTRTLVDTSGLAGASIAATLAPRS